MINSLKWRCPGCHRHYNGTDTKMSPLSISVGEKYSNNTVNTETKVDANVVALYTAMFMLMKLTNSNNDNYSMVKVNAKFE